MPTPAERRAHFWLYLRFHLEQITQQAFPQCWLVDESTCGQAVTSALHHYRAETGDTLARGQALDAIYARAEFTRRYFVRRLADRTFAVPALRKINL